MSSKNYHTVFDNIIKECVDKDEILYEDIPEMSLITSFWFMRLNSAHCSSIATRQVPPVTIDKVSKAISIIQDAIFKHFSNKILSDFKNYKLDLIDSNFDISHNIDYSSFPAENNEEKLFIDHLHHLTYGIQQLSREIHILQTNYPKYIQETIPNITKPSQLALLKAKSEYKRNSLEANHTPEIWPCYKEDIDKSYNLLTELTTHIECLFTFNNDSFFEKVILFLSESNSHINPSHIPFIKNLIFELRYPDLSSFNKETISIFLFSRYKNYTISPLVSTLIQKYENLFKNLYCKLRAKSHYIDEILFPHVLASRNQICENYIGGSWPSIDFKEHFSIFNLKKLISLYYIHKDLSQNTFTQHEDSIFRDFHNLFNFTKLPFMAYHPALNNLFDYMTKDLDINQKELANLLDQNPATISRKKKNNELLDSYQWFWVAAEGCTYEYLNGETTIPFYGKSTHDQSDKYLIALVSRFAFAELFLQEISNLRDYKLAVGRSGKTKQNPLSFLFLSEISKKAIALASTIQQCRISIDSSCELLHNEYPSYSDNISDSIAKNRLDINQEYLLNLLDLFNNLLEQWVNHDKVKISSNNKDNFLLQYHITFLIDIVNSFNYIFSKLYNEKSEHLKTIRNQTQELINTLADILSNISKQNNE